MSDPVINPKSQFSHDMAHFNLVQRLYKLSMKFLLLICIHIDFDGFI